MGWMEDGIQPWSTAEVLSTAVRAATSLIYVYKLSETTAEGAAAAALHVASAMERQGQQ
jgi:hypothetical protein